MAANSKIEPQLSQAALACVDEAFGDVLSTLLVGGRAVGLVRRNSDIDLMVLTANVDVPSLPFKFPTPDGVCEVEYHPAPILHDRLAGFEKALAKLAKGSESYGKAKFLAETASRLLTGQHLSGVSCPTAAIGITNVELEEICVRWVWFRYAMIELTIDLFRRSASGVNAHLEPQDIAGIAFERSCRAALVELVCAERSFYISGRYKWLGTLLTRHDRADVWAYLSRTRQLGGNKLALSSSDPQNAGLKAFAGSHRVPRLFQIALCPGARHISLTNTEVLIESADRCVISITPALALIFARPITIKDLTAEECDDLAELIRRRFIWIVPELL